MSIIFLPQSLSVFPAQPGARHQPGVRLSREPGTYRFMIRKCPASEKGNTLFSPWSHICFVTELWQQSLRLHLWTTEQAIHSWYNSQARRLAGSLNYLSFAVMKHHDQGTLESLWFELMGSEGWSPGWQSRGREAETAESSHPYPQVGARDTGNGQCFESSKPIPSDTSLWTRPHILVPKQFHQRGSNIQTQICGGGVDTLIQTSTQATAIQQERVNAVSRLMEWDGKQELC